MALHLGMNPLDPEDEPLLWIAAEAYDAALPDNWTEHFDWQGQVYFFCRETDTVSRDHPLDELYRQLCRDYRSQNKAQAGAGSGESPTVQEEEVGAAAARLYKGGGVSGNPVECGAGTATESRGGMGAVGVRGPPQRQVHLQPHQQTHQHQYLFPTQDVPAPATPYNTLIPVLANPVAAAILGTPGDGNELTLVVAPQRAEFEAAGSAAVVALRERLERAESAAAEARTKALEERFEAKKCAFQDQVTRAEERASAAEKSAAEVREKAQAMMMKALEVAASIGSGQNKRAVDVHEMLLAKERELEDARARAGAAEEEAAVAKAKVLAVEELIKSRGAGLQVERAGAHKVWEGVDITLVEMERTKVQLNVPAVTQQQQQLLLLPPDPAAVGTAAVAASQATKDAEEPIRALRQKVSRLEEDENNRARRELTADEDRLEHLKGKTQLSKKFRKGVEWVQLRAADLQKRQHTVEEDMRQLQLYTFTKVEHCAATVSKMGAQLEQAIKERDMLKSAVTECDLQIGPLIREKRRLFNEMLTAKGNIRVYCRVRPISERELDEGAQVAVVYPPDDGANRLIRLVG